MRKSFIVILLAALLVLAPALALADNNILTVKPLASGGTYGTAQGQIDTPVAVKVDAGDNIYILQHVHTSKDKFKSVITVFDRNLTLVRSFDVLKTSMVDVGWPRAHGQFYYDDLASAFDIDANGTIYILCGWDVVVMDRKGNYLYQFPVSSFMGWIDNTNGTQFYYPHGLTLSSDGYVVITSGSTLQKHEIIFINPDGKLFMKMETPVKDMCDLARDRNGSLYVTGAGTNVVHVYDASMTKEKDLTLNFNGTYSGNPASLAFLSDNDLAASANGVFVYYKNGSISAHFMDNNLSRNNVSWNRPIAVNSTDWLVVVSGRQDAGKTPQPILLYQYSEGAVVGEPEQTDVCAGILVGFGLFVAFYLCARRFLLI